jgi:hypothetical protein
MQRWEKQPQEFPVATDDEVQAYFDIRNELEMELGI